MRSIVKLLYFLIFSILIVVTPLLSEEIIIVDANNVTRATAAVERDGLIEFSLEDEAGQPADGVEVTLRNTETGEEIVRTSISGIVMFYNVSAGIWEVTSVVNWVTFSSVSISTGSAAAASAAGAGGSAGAGAGGGLLLGPAIQPVLIGGAILGGTGAIIAVADDQRSSSSGGDPSPSASPDPTSHPTATPKPTRPPGGGGGPIFTPTPKPTPVPTRIPPVSPFT